MAGSALDGSTLNLPENSDSRQQREVLDALPVLIFLERDGAVVFANAEARHEIGIVGEWQETALEDVLWGLFPGTAEPQTDLTGGRRGSPFHASLTCKGGRMVAVEGTYSTLNPDLREAVIVAHVSGRERVTRPGVMEDVLASLPEAVAIVCGANVLYTNPAFTRTFGYAPEEASGASVRELLVPETRVYEHFMLLKVVDEKGHASAETVRLNKHGELVDVALQIAPLKISGTKAGYVFTFRDIGERKQVEAKLQHDAMHDVLTGLPNRALFMDRLKLALSRRERRSNQGCAVFFLDLDRFKQINDNLGHAAGDSLLVGMAERLCRVLRPHDTAARMGGDEFAILVENIISVADLDALAQRVIAELERPFEVLGHQLQVLSSIGIALASDEHRTPDQLVQDADVAMYRAKQEGGRRYAIFDRHMEVQVTSRQIRERELRDLLMTRDFVYWYQPIYRLGDGRLEGFEALLRRKTPGGAAENVRDLLQVAEDTGMSIPLGRESIEAACARILEWDRTVPGNSLLLSVNLTRRQFYHEDLILDLKKALTATRIDPSRLMLEVSEATVNEDPDQALVHMQRMVDCGVRLAMDNFGGALAALNHLVRMPIHVIKLDMKLTTSVTGTGRQLAIAESLIHACRAAGVQVLAQGIETQGHLRILQEMGCQLGQGFYLAPPLDPEQAQYLASHNGPHAAFRE